jgi:hypothetical protein
MMIFDWIIGDGLDGLDGLDGWMVGCCWMLLMAGSFWEIGAALDEGMISEALFGDWGCVATGSSDAEITTHLAGGRSAFLRLR